MKGIIPNVYYSVVLLLLCCTNLNLSGQNYTWVKKADLPEPNYQGASFTIGNKVYLVGGVIDHINTPVNLSRHVWEYDPTSNSWTQKHDAPGTAVFGASSFVIGNYGYIVNGWDSTNIGTGPPDCWQYDPSSDTWTAMAPFPGSTRYTCAAFALNGKGYVTVGFKPYVNDTWEFDPVANHWTQKSNFPGTPRQSTTWFAIGNYGYVGMGVPQSNGWAYFASDFYRYDPSSDTWTQLNSFPGQPIIGEGTFVMGGDAYVVCNESENQYNFANGASRDIWKYDPTIDNWSYWGVFPDTGIVGGSHVSCNGSGYIGQGEHYVVGTYSRVWWTFGQSPGPYSCTAAISQFLINNATSNFQASGSFSTTAQLSWNFGDGQTGAGTSVIHSYAHNGTYVVTLTVSDSSLNCSSTAVDTVVISNVSNCTVSIGSVNIGGQFTLYANANGNGPYTYLWSNPNDSTFNSTSPDPIVYISPNDSATYCVTITDTTGCSASSCTTITYIPVRDSCQTSLYIFPNGNIPGLYYAYIYHTGAPPVSYSWTFGNGGTSLDSLPSYTYPVAGYFDICLTITDSSGCVSSFCDSLFYAFKTGGGEIHELDVLQRLATGIPTLNGQIILSVFPNPANDLLEIRAGGKEAEQADIFTIDGKKVKGIDHPEQNIIDISSLSDGIYFLEVKVNGQTGRVKFVKAN